MPEIEKPLPGSEGGENGEGSGADKGGTGSEGEGDKKPEGQDGGEGGDKKPAEADKGSQGKDDEPPVRTRKTVKDFIIERKERKIAKLEGEKAGKDGEGAGDDADEDDEIDPADRKVIAQVVTPMLKPLLEKSLQAEDEAEVSDFLKANPDFKPYEAKARQWMTHPSRRNLPIKSIFYEVAGDDLMKIGAKRAKDAEDEANRSGAGGGNSRGSEGGTSVKDLSKEEFAKKQEDIRRSR